MTRFYFLLPFIFTLGACSTWGIPKSNAPEPIVVERIVTKTVPIDKPAPQVPQADQLDLRNVTWHVITPENFEEKISEMEARGEEPVLFAMTTQGYENLSLNISDLRASLAQHQRIIAIYEDSYD